MSLFRSIEQHIRAYRAQWRVRFYLRQRRLIDGRYARGLLASRCITGGWEYRLPTHEERKQHIADTAL